MPSTGLVPTPQGSAIARYLRGKTVLLTGGTGFLGKVIVERLLRTAPDIGRIYLLIRSRHAVAGPAVTAARRFEAEVLPSAAFSTLAAHYGDKWRSFAWSRLVPVEGDVSLPRLGLTEPDHGALASRVELVINAAASVAFDEPLDSALAHNVRGVEHVARFARECRAAALVHVSTAFVAGRRTGRFPEGPLTPDVSAIDIEAIEDTIAAVLRESPAGTRDHRATRARLVEAGMARARHRGWHDIYSYTKALGEMVLARDRGDVPTAILRPTIIESSLRDPSPGWLENLNVGDPLFVEFGRGRMPDFPLAIDAVLDMVPVDFVANALLAVLARAGDSPAISHYTVGSGALNPLTGARIHELTYEYFTNNPMYDRRGQPIASSRLTFPSYEQFRATYGEQAGRSATMKRLMYLAELYETYTHAGCVFDTANTERLLDDLDAVDRAMLDFDVRRIDWRHYLQEVHIPGLRRHVLGEDLAAREAVRRRA